MNWGKTAHGLVLEEELKHDTEQTATKEDKELQEV